MCGIFGEISNGSVDLKGFRDGMALLSDRGPDDSGEFLEDGVAIGHRRLAIIDIEANRQPLVSLCKRYVISFNGEIYNYLELNNVLLDAGVSVPRVNDTAVLLELFVLMGESCLPLLNGMFAFVVWDRQERSIFAARDRMGEKPFYYSLDESSFFFASTVSAIKKFKRISLDVNTLAVVEFFSHQYVSTDSIYKNVLRLPPGNYLRYSFAKGVELKKYWELRPTLDEKLSYLDAQENLRGLIGDSIALRLRSDVPLGVFLSGGLDSSIITSVASARLGSITSFCVGFDGKSYDESKLAEEVSRFFQVGHRQIPLEANPPDLLDILNSIVAVIGEPFADPAIVPTWSLCKVSAKDVRVALSGDGADEVFGGYRRYLAGKYLAPYARNSMLGGGLALLSHILGDNREYFSSSFSKKVRLLSEYIENRKYFDKDLRPKLFSPDQLLKLMGNKMKGELEISGRAQGGGTWLLRHQLSDMADYLPNDILVKTDRISMHFGLEVRTPFLDHRIVEAAFSYPDSFKVYALKQKRVLVSAYRTQLPKTVYSRPKHGFSPPIHAWLEGELKEVIASAIDDSRMKDYVNTVYVEHLWGEHRSGRIDHSRRLWCIVIFYLWLCQNGV